MGALPNQPIIFRSLHFRYKIFTACICDVPTKTGEKKIQETSQSVYSATGLIKLEVKKLLTNNGPSWSKKKLYKNLYFSIGM